MARLIDSEYDSLGVLVSVIIEDDGDTCEFEPVRHGKWSKDVSYPVYDDGMFVGYYYVCSECGEAIYDDHGLYNYCPNCGAKMDTKE